MKYMIALLIILSCSNERKKSYNSSCDDVTFHTLKVNVLGKDIDSLPNYECFSTTDTLLEGNEGVSWRAKAYFFERRLSFLAETSWEDNKFVKRVTVLNHVVRDKELFVGQQLGNFRHLVSKEIPSSPDGYLFLTYDHL